MYVAHDGFGVRANPFILSEIGMKHDMFYVKSRCKKIREFGTRHSRYTNYRVSLTGEIAILFARRFLFKRHGLLSHTRQLTIPSFVFSSFRKCVFYALIMYYYINRRAIYVLDCCSSSSGMLFQFNWNPVPTYLEQGSILAVTKRDIKKPTTKAYRAGPKKSPLLN